MENSVFYLYISLHIKVVKSINFDKRVYKRRTSCTVK
jgi:hypothetical protein